MKPCDSRKIHQWTSIQTNIEIALNTTLFSYSIKAFHVCRDPVLQQSDPQYRSSQIMQLENLQISGSEGKKEVTVTFLFTHSAFTRPDRFPTCGAYHESSVSFRPRANWSCTSTIVPNKFSVFHFSVKTSPKIKMYSPCL